MGRGRRRRPRRPVRRGAPITPAGEIDPPVPALEPLGRAALFFESRLVPFLYAYSGFVQLQRTYLRRDEIADYITRLAIAPSASEAAGSLVFLFARAVKLSSVLICIAVIFELARKKEMPRKFSNLYEIAVPLAAVTLSLSAQLVIGALDSIHGAMALRLLPFTVGVRAIGWSLVLGGRMLALAGILTLGSAFSIFVEVRHLVSDGVYRYIRHPIYLGDALSMAGVFLIASSMSVLSFALILMAFLVIRALMEERSLSKAFPAYAAAKSAGPSVHL